MTQEYYWVRFTDKSGSQFNPLDYFHPTALERRISHNLNLADSSDYPVSNSYLFGISTIADTLLGESRWLNCALVRANQEQITIINKLPYVWNSTKYLNTINTFCAINKDLKENEEEVRRHQVESLGLDFLQEQNLTGAGIRIAIFDGGFPGVEKHEGLKFLADNGQITDSWNFPSRNSTVFKNNPHGTAVLSCVAGKANGQPTGLAPDSEFLLARTELEGEPWREQLYWIQAAEWADKNGAMIICSALGYTSDHYFQEEMDGSSPVAEAARMAFNKGILVVNSIGNDGSNSWKYLGTPADAEEVLSIGAADPVSMLKLDFSSFGPSTSGIMKPNLMAAGKVLAATPKAWKVMFGTSFSAPLIAGYAACLWQKFPFLTNKQLFQLIEQTGRLYPYYDYAHGYGIPDANRIPAIQASIPVGILSTELSQNLLIVKTPQEAPANRKSILYYHIAGLDGKILAYKVLEYTPGQDINIDLSSFSRPKIIRIRVPGYYTKILYEDVD